MLSLKRVNKTLLSKNEYNRKYAVPHNSFEKTYGERSLYFELNTIVHKQSLH